MSFLLVWRDLILTALILSLFSFLDRSGIYFATSLGLVAASRFYFGLGALFRNLTNSNPM
jgi:hypothetical protein